MPRPAPQQNPWVELASRARALKPVAGRAGLLQRFDAIDRQLVQAKFPPCSPWWRAELERFLAAGRRRWLLRVGRRGGKSTTLCRLAVAWAIYGDWDVPPGDIGVVAFVSVNRQEASGRLRTIAEILTALGVPFDRRPGEIELKTARPAMFRVFACTLTGVVGFTAIAVLCDEVAKWRAADTGANPAEEVVRSLAPTLATQPNGFLVLSSSPWSTQDYHALQFAEGDTERQLTAWAPTHVANPTPEVAEEQTRKEEPDEITWQREYGAIPSDGLSDNWFGPALELAITTESAPKHYATRYHIAIDPAFTKDRFGFAVLASHKEPGTGRRVTWVHCCDSWDPSGLKPSELARRVKTELCDVYKQTHVYSDQYEGSSFTELCQQEGIYIEVVDWTTGQGPKSKTGRYKSVRTAMLEERFRVPSHPDLLREFREVYGIYGDGGQERVQSLRTDLGHGDRVSALVLGGSIALEHAAQDIQEEPPLPGSPEWQALEGKRMRDRAIKEARKRQRGDGGRLI